MTLPQSVFKPWIEPNDLAEMARYVKQEIIDSYRSRPTVIIGWKGADGKDYKAEMPMMSYSSDPFDWGRYGSHTMRAILSEANRLQLILDCEAALALAHAEVGAMTQENADGIASKCSIKYVSPEEVWARESYETKHDQQAANDALRKVCIHGGEDIHLGATTYDKVDNMWAVTLWKACDILEKRNLAWLKTMYDRVTKMEEIIGAGRTHRQHAVPITVMAKLLRHMYDLNEDVKGWSEVKGKIRSKGFRGAIGTSNSFVKVYENPANLRKIVENPEYLKALGLDNVPKDELLKNRNYIKEMAKFAADLLDKKAMSYLAERTGVNVPVATLSSQIVSRRILLDIYNQIQQSVETADNFAFEVVDLQRTEIWEWIEGFDPTQYSSSTMPIKKNPVNSENIQGQARIMRGFGSGIAENRRTAHERSLEDSSFERAVIPKIFLIGDEALRRANRVAKGLYINKGRIVKNADMYSNLLMGESLIFDLYNRGMARHEAHAVIRDAGLEIMAGEVTNKYKAVDILAKFIPQEIMQKEEIGQALNLSEYVGLVQKRSEEMIKEVENTLSTFD
jgi:adenylosuccinate lyase